MDSIPDRRRLKLCNIVDKQPREMLAMAVGRSRTADGVVAIIERLVAHEVRPSNFG